MTFPWFLSRKLRTGENSEFFWPKISMFCEKFQKFDYLSTTAVETNEIKYHDFPMTWT